MKSRLTHRVLVALGMSVGLCALPGDSQACCLFGRSNTTYYAPYVAAYPVAPACNTCNYAPAPVCNTCNYVPQVSYRSVFTSVPVTAYRPVTMTNPCTGCPTTVMQPVTTYRMQPSIVPVTSYMPVQTCGYAAPACATGACGVAAAPIASSYYTPVAPAAPACSTCNGGGATYTPAAPSTLGPATSVPSIPQGVAVPQPDASSSITAPRTFRPDTSLPGTSPLVRPIPDTSAPSETRNSNTFVPRGNDLPDRQTARPREDRLTARPIQDWSVRPASLTTPAVAESTTEEGNWHAAGR